MGNETTEGLAPYAGRWVALIGDLVVGVGHTADEALILAQRNRPKERIKLHFVEKNEGEELPSWSLLERLRSMLVEHPLPVYLVGGAVRDALLGLRSHDLDFVVPHGAIQLAFDIADRLDAPAYVLDRDRDTGRVILAAQETTLDFAGFRGSDLEADLKDRDFTINAMALPINARRASSVIDPCRGRSDLAVELIRQTHDRVMQNDPVRALRAIRLALELNFRVSADTGEAASRAGRILHQVSVERLRDELLKMLQTGRLHDAISQMQQMGLLEVTLPEIAALADVIDSPPLRDTVLDHTIAMLRWLNSVESAFATDKEGDQVEVKTIREILSAFAEPLAHHLGRKVDGGVDGRTLLWLGALFHDVGKARVAMVDEGGRGPYLADERAGAELTGKRLRHLRLSGEAIAHVQRIVAGHIRLQLLAKEASQLPAVQPTLGRRAVYRFFRDAQTAGLDICLLALAEHLATYRGPGEEGDWRKLLNLVAELFHHYFEEHSNTIAPTPLLSGRDLMRMLHLEPGPEIGRMLRLIVEAQAAGEVTTREEAYEYAQSIRH